MTEEHRQGEPESTPLGKNIKASIPNLHKGDVGGPNAANEQVYQGSKNTEFNPPSNPSSPEKGG